MAFQTFKSKREAITLTALGEEIAARRDAVGAVDVPRNSGARRTPGKVELLKQIAKAGGTW